MHNWTPPVVRNRILSWWPLLLCKNSVITGQFSKLCTSHSVPILLWNVLKIAEEQRLGSKLWVPLNHGVYYKAGIHLQMIAEVYLGHLMPIVHGSRDILTSEVIGVYLQCNQLQSNLSVLWGLNYGQSSLSVPWEKAACQDNKGHDSTAFWLARLLHIRGREFYVWWPAPFT